MTFSNLGTLCPLVTLSSAPGHKPSSAGNSLGLTLSPGEGPWVTPAPDGALPGSSPEMGAAFLASQQVGFPLHDSAASLGPQRRPGPGELCIMDEQFGSGPAGLPGNCPAGGWHTWWAQ